MPSPLAVIMISMKYRDLRDFLSLLERGELKRISQPIDPYGNDGDCRSHPAGGRPGIAV